jgi:hypothetical protein
VLIAHGDGAGALAAYQRGLAIRQALAARDPHETRLALTSKMLIAQTHFNSPRQVSLSMSASRRLILPPSGDLRQDFAESSRTALEFTHAV